MKTLKEALFSRKNLKKSRIKNCKTAKDFVERIISTENPNPEFCEYCIIEDNHTAILGITLNVGEVNDFVEYLNQEEVIYCALNSDGRKELYEIVKSSNKVIVTICKTSFYFWACFSPEFYLENIFDRKVQYTDWVFINTFGDLIEEIKNQL